MGHLKIGQIVEAGLWLLLVAALYAWSFEFDREIEIYKFGASAWPRTILLLIAVAAIGQLAYYWKVGERRPTGVAAVMDESAEAAPATPATGNDSDSGDSHRLTSLRWYLWTFFLLSLPFAYLIVPQWMASWWSLDKAALHSVKLGCAGALILMYAASLRGNPVGGMLTLPVFFGALMQDMGFYFLAPFFAVGVMYLMGERRPGRIALITAIILGLVLMLFVSVLYVGLPTGNLSPFYEFGTGLVNLLQ